jgi:DNA-binding SARP family transcriptional activator
VTAAPLIADPAVPPVEGLPVLSRIPGQRTVSRPAGGSAEIIQLHDDPPRCGGGVALRLLGDFQLVLDGRLAEIGATGQRLLAALACRGGPVPRAQLAAMLWPDSPRVRAHANLRTTVYRLQRRLHGVVCGGSTHLHLADAVQVDLLAAVDAAQTLLSAADLTGEGQCPDPELLRAASQVDLTADLLPDWSEDWLADHQFNFRRLRIDALEALSRLLAASGQFGAAVQNALVAVQADPLRDSAHETLIRVCVAQGNRHDAFAHYRNYRTVLRTELGLDPPAHLDRLVWGAA